MFQTIEALEMHIANMLDVPLEDLSGYPDSLLDFGLDSILVMGFAEQLKAEGIPIAFNQLAAQLTLPQWWTLIQEKQSQIAV